MRISNVKVSFIGRFPPINRGERIIHHKVIMVRCSSSVNRVNRPAAVSSPHRRSAPTGSISASGQWPGPEWIHHFSFRSNMPLRRFQSSQKSSVIRHILAYCLRCCASSTGAGPGERLSTMSRPQLRQACEISSISLRQWGYSLAMSSHFTKSTPHSAYSRKILS